MSRLEKLLDLQDWKLKQLERWLTTRLSFAIKHLPDKEESIYKVFKTSVVILFISKSRPECRKRISCTLESLPKSKWTTFLDNLSSSKDQNTLALQLLQILLQELTSRGRAFRPFWTPVYKDVSEKLLLPTGIDFVGSDLSSSNNWSPKQVEESLSFKTVTTRLQNKSLQKICSPSFMSSLADKWEEEAMPIVKLKTLKIKIYPTKHQKKLLDQFIDTSRFVYNRTIEHIEKGNKVNFHDIRDVLVTENTKKGVDEYKVYDGIIGMLKKQKEIIKDRDKYKDEIKLIDENIQILNQNRRNAMKSYDYTKNPLINDFETETPKDIRACAVKRCCDAYKTGFSNLKNGNIKFFKMHFKKKTEPIQSIELTPKIISIRDGDIRIAPEYFKGECTLKSNKKINQTIENNVDIVRRYKEYYLHMSVKTEPKECKQTGMIAGIDPGIRTFATVHSHNNDTTIIKEYKHRADMLKRLNMKLTLLKSAKRIRKKQKRKIEKKKRDLVDRLHWDFVNNLLSENDVIYFGDIKSHDIVNGGKNKSLNVAFNDLKFYQLKQRLMYKAYLYGKKVFMVPEHYTTKTCSNCGTINDNVGSKEVFECTHCKMITGRDFNASKNMKLKGFFV
jgi:IS605 OrfB family transposase